MDNWNFDGLLLITVKPGRTYILGESSWADAMTAEVPVSLTSDRNC